MAGDPLAPLGRLAARLAEVRRAESDGIARLFRTLGPRLAAARDVERELDRALATRFNPLDYLHTKELGLSRIIADLLDPSAAHGQGAAFLMHFLDLLQQEQANEPPLLPGFRQKLNDELSRDSLPTLDPASVETRCERPIDGGGRLDISIEIRTGDAAPWCVAIENKPYAADGEGQVQAYLEFLRCGYADRFLLIYLSPHGGMPSAWSLPADARADGLATIAYCPRAEPDAEASAERQLDFALTDWLRECGLSCDIDRLRWFLRDTENFCHKTFGGVMTTDREHRDVRDFILESEDNLLAALAVLDAYPKTRNEVIARFLERVYERVAQDLEQENLEGNCYFADKTKDDGMWVFRDSWEREDSELYIWLGHASRDASWWWLGVGSFGPKDRAMCERLRDMLPKCLGPGDSSDNFLWYRYLDPPHRDWAPLLVQMHEERKNPGELVEHFATKFIDFARKALAVIDRDIPNA